MTYRYYIGQQAYILITDLDILKQIMVKDFDNFSDHNVTCMIGMSITVVANIVVISLPVVPPTSHYGSPQYI